MTNDAWLLQQQRGAFRGSAADLYLQLLIDFNLPVERNVANHNVVTRKAHSTPKELLFCSCPKRRVAQLYVISVHHWLIQNRRCRVKRMSSLAAMEIAFHRSNGAIDKITAEMERMNFVVAIVRRHYLWCLLIYPRYFSSFACSNFSSDGRRDSWETNVNMGSDCIC